MAEIKSYRCRYTPRWREGEKHLTYEVPVSWWSYRDDRMDARSAPEKTKAVVSVMAYDAEEARRLVFREWGNYSMLIGIGQAKLKQVAA